MTPRHEHTIICHDVVDSTRVVGILKSQANTTRTHGQSSVVCMHNYVYRFDFDNTENVARKQSTTK